MTIWRVHRPTGVCPQCNPLLEDAIPTPTSRIPPQSECNGSRSYFLDGASPEVKVNYTAFHFATPVAEQLAELKVRVSLFCLPVAYAAFLFRSNEGASFV
jgi:hypothetical protein